MKISDLISMCVRNLVRRKIRTFLTVIGVIIGTTSIIMMISLGIGISRQQEEQMKMWSDLTIIEVWNSGGENADVVLNDDAVANLRAIANVDTATPFVHLRTNGEPSIMAGKNYRYRLRYPSITGVFPDSLEKMGFQLGEGEGLPTGKSRKLYMVFGQSAAYQFEDTKKKFGNMRSDWPDENGVIQEPFFDPLSADFKLVLPPDGSTEGAKRLEYEFEVAGTLVGERNKWDTMYGMFISLEELNRIQAEYDKENGVKVRKGDKKFYENVRVKAVDMESVPAIEQAIHDMGFPNTWSAEGQRQEAQQSMRVMQIILGSIGGITLLTSAFSIANTMITSVYERTREIGVMKVLGCLVGNIRSLFLLEAGFIGFFGGIFGVGLSFLLSFLLNRFGAALMQGEGGNTFGRIFGVWGGMEGVKMSVIPLWLVLLGMAFATGIGLVAGFYPANRAVRISAMEAIKQE